MPLYIYTSTSSWSSCVIITVSMSFIFRTHRHSESLTGTGWPETSPPPDVGWSSYPLGATHIGYHRHHWLFWDALSLSHTRSSFFKSQVSLLLYWLSFPGFLNQEHLVQKTSKHHQKHAATGRKSVIWAVWAPSLLLPKLSEDTHILRSSHLCHNQINQINQLVPGCTRYTTAHVEKNQVLWCLAWVLATAHLVRKRSTRATRHKSQHLQQAAS